MNRKSERLPFGLRSNFLFFIAALKSLWRDFSRFITKTYSRLILRLDPQRNAIQSFLALILLKEWVLRGGALGMCGGYLSFAGIQASAKYYRTPIEEILPVQIHTFDDRVEAPQGVQPEIVDHDHPAVSGISGK